MLTKRRVVTPRGTGFTVANLRPGPEWENWVYVLLDNGDMAQVHKSRVWVIR